MLRALLLYLSQASWARRIVTRWSVAWRVASRFVAGETLDEAVRLVKTLNEQGLYVTLDHLGEYTRTAEVAVRAADEAIEILERIDSDGLVSGLSIKLSQIGMAVDETLCEQNLQRILSCAHEKQIFVRIDMEDSTYVDRTLALYHRMVAVYGVETVGVVLQSYLFRSLEDTRTLIEMGARIRLVKGAYKEPETVAFAEKADVDANLDRMTDVMIAASLARQETQPDRGGRLPPILALASHDDERVAYAKDAAAAAGLPKRLVEIQFLNGIRRDLRETLVAEGYPVRIYVPFGVEWYPYMVRRLAERPANLMFFLSNLFRK